MRNNRGITLITLTVAVLIMIILSSMLIYNAKNGLKIKNLKDMQNDIEILEDKVNAYYVKYAELPAEIEYLGNINFEPQPNDDDKYYVLDLKALEGISLNYGSEFTQIKSEEDTYKYNDIYIINKQSMHIYYAKGVEIDGVAYYTNSEDTNVTSLRGNYLIAQKRYADTLEKALEIAQNGETIKVLKDVQEETSVEITKNITIDTNGKIMTYKEGQTAIVINSNINVNIIGNGTIKSEVGQDYAFIRNSGILKVENTTINSNNSGSVNGGTIRLFDNGEIISNNSNINSISSYNGKNIEINGGEYNFIGCSVGNKANVIINIENATIKEIILHGSEFNLKSGKIEKIIVTEDPNLISITIGDIDKTVNNENPIVNLIMNGSASPDSSCNIIFNNGIIGGFSNIIDSLDDDELLDGTTGKYENVTIREGYKVKKTDEGYILVPKS